jgi:hypothetical protein
MGSFFFIVSHAGQFRGHQSFLSLIYRRMQEIANGTHSYQLLNEIMPLIYKRFTDKTAEEWRQIYKVHWATVMCLM